MTALCEEMQRYIARLPDDKLTVIRPLCLYLLYGGKADEDDEPLIIEPDLTNEEKAIIARSMKKRALNPGDFVNLDDYINEREARET